MILHIYLSEMSIVCVSFFPSFTICSLLSHIVNCTVITRLLPRLSLAGLEISTLCCSHRKDIPIHLTVSLNST